MTKETPVHRGAPGRRNARHAITERELRRAVGRARKRLADPVSEWEDALTVEEAACLFGVSIEALEAIVELGCLGPVTAPPPWAPKFPLPLLRLGDVERLARNWDKHGPPPLFAEVWANRKPRPDEAGVIVIRADAVDIAVCEFERRVTAAAIAARSSVTVGEAAALLGVTDSRIRMMCAESTIAERETTSDPCVGRGRSFDRASLIRLKQARAKRKLSATRSP